MGGALGSKIVEKFSAKKMIEKAELDDDDDGDDDTCPKNEETTETSSSKSSFPDPEKEFKNKVNARDVVREKMVQTVEKQKNKCMKILNVEPLEQSAVEEGGAEAAAAVGKEEEGLEEEGEVEQEKLEEKEIL